MNEQLAKAAIEYMRANPDYVAAASFYELPFEVVVAMVRQLLAESK